MPEPCAVSLVIPTYRRGAILLATLEKIRAFRQVPAEVLVVDQTERHPPEVGAALARLEQEGGIRWLRLPSPGIPQAMNAGLRSASQGVVLFLDDDIDPAPDLAGRHAARHGGPHAAVVGQVLQPGQQPVESSGSRGAGLRRDLDFAFNGIREAEVGNVMAGNLSVCRDVALAVGGFDENYLGSAYRFETDFARRLVAAGHRILFAPEASLRHLRLSTGGTRSVGDHLRHPSPLHAVGDHYFALRHGEGREWISYLLRRCFKECINRFYAGRPWLMPRKLLSELRAFALARKLRAQGPALMDPGGGQ